MKLDVGSFAVYPQKVVHFLKTVEVAYCCSVCIVAKSSLLDVLAMTLVS